MKDKKYVSEVVIGVLILIIISLIFKLLSLEVDFLPDWFFDNLFLGTFTLGGAFFGAMVAGKHAVNSVKEQINDNNDKIEKATHETFLKIYLVVKPTFTYFASTLNEILNDIHHKGNNTNYIKKADLITKTVNIINKVNDFSSDYDKYNHHELAFDYYREIVSGEKIITTSLFHLNELRNSIINSDDDVIPTYKQLVYLKTNLEHLEGIIKRLESYEALSYEKIV